MRRLDGIAPESASLLRMTLPLSRKRDSPRVMFSGGEDIPGYAIAYAGGFAGRMPALPGFAELQSCFCS